MSEMKHEMLRLCGESVQLENGKFVFTGRIIIKLDSEKNGAELSVATIHPFKLYDTKDECLVAAQKEANEVMAQFQSYLDSVGVQTEMHQKNGITLN